MSLINVNVPNLLNGVSQQADPLRFVTQGNEQINGMSSVTEGLSKRNSSKFLHKLSNNSYQKNNPKLHFINRDRNERYLVLLYGNIEPVYQPRSDYGRIRIWNIVTGKEINIKNRYEDVELLDENLPITTWGGQDYPPFIGLGYSAADYTDGEPFWAVNLAFERTAQSYYIGHNPEKNIKMFTVADTTFVLNTDRTVRTVASSRPASLQGKTVTRVGTTATVNMGTGVSNSIVNIGEVVQVLGTFTAIAGSVRVTGKPNGTSWTFDTVDAGATTYSGASALSFEKGERLVPFDMPHTLIRQSDGTFLLERNYWDARGTGTPASNPNPSFVGKKLNDIFMYRSRLGFLADENVILSENSSFYNFYRTEMSTLLDSDPIDVSTAHSKVSILKHAVPFSERLVLFSDEAQFYMTAADILTPKTASIQQTTEFSVDQLSKPTIVGKNIFFPFSRGKFSGIMEYFVTQDTLEFNGTDVTAVIPSYLAGNIKKIVSSNNEQIVVVMTEDAPTTLYVYKYFTAENQKIQSSWSKWEYPETENVKILDVEFIENELYLVVDNADQTTKADPNAAGNLFYSKRGLTIESINVKELTNDVTDDEFIKLDKKLDESKVISKEYNAVNDTTSFVLPYHTNSAITVVGRGKDQETVYGYDGSPNNDNLVTEKDFDNISSKILLNRGTSTNLYDFQSFGNSTTPIISLAGRGSRNWYSTSGAVGDPTGTNGIFCSICAIPYYPGSYNNIYTIHWAIERYTDYLTHYLVSKPYPDYTQFNFDVSDPDNPFFRTTGASPTNIAHSTNLPSSLPLYPWEVDTWYPIVYPPPASNTAGYGFQVDEFFKILDTKKYLRRGNETSTTILPPVKAGKLFPIKNTESVEIEIEDNQGYFRDNTKITIDGNHLTTPLWFGIPYDFKYQFSNPMLRLASGGQKVAVSDGRFQVKNGSLTFNDTVAFNIEVTAPFRNKSVYKFSNYTLGRGDAILDTIPIKSGAFRFPVLSRNDKELKVEIVNNTPFPSSFISMDWEAFYSARARRI
jgi:hypothetical protein